MEATRSIFKSDQQFQMLKERQVVKIENIHWIYLYIDFSDPDGSNSSRILEKTRWQWIKELSDKWESKMSLVKVFKKVDKEK